MMLRPLLALVILASALASQVPTCSGAGLAVTGGRFGDPWSIELFGVPGGTGILAADVAAGPVATSFGPVCLGLTTALVMTSVALDAAGNYSASGVLPLAAGFTAGSTLSVQGAIAHASLPGGATLTNGWTVSFRPPELMIVAPGVVGLAPGDFIVVDAVTDTVALATTPVVASYAQAFRIPGLGWIGWKTNAGPYTFVDDATGAFRASVPGISSPISPQYPPPAETTAVSSDGSIFYTYYPTFPAIVRSYALPSGALLAAANLTGGPSSITPIPGTSLLYLRFLDRFEVLDGLNGLILATIPTIWSLSSTDVVAHGGFLYARTPAGLIAIDTTAHAVVLGPVPSPMSNPSFFLGVGPGTAGPALWMAGITPGFPLVELSLATLTTVSSYSLPSAPGNALVSAGGTEWLIELAAAPGQPLSLYWFKPATNSAALLVSSYTPGSLAVIRSGALSKAYARLGSGDLVPIPTDPIGPLGAVIPLPPTVSQALKLLSN